MDLNHYRFENVWQLKYPPEDVYRVLEDIGEYPRWWPEVRQVVRIDDRTVRILVRSFLPYDLSFLAVESRKDPNAGILETAMSGDLDGFSRWIIEPDGKGTRATFQEEVIARKPLLRRLALVARPFFRFNHALMMRNGRKGLSVYLAGFRAGVSEPAQGGGRPGDSDRARLRAAGPVTRPHG
jgi:hypothetical protein